jgi:DNA-binding ferritin-like protein
MMMTEQLGKAIAQLADCAAALAGNFHTMHLNYQGLEFDTMHKKVLRKYYEQLDSDYDALAEWARCYDVVALNKNESAQRVELVSFQGTCDWQTAIVNTNTWLRELVNMYMEVFHIVNKIEDCPIAIGIANWLQTRLEYWAKETFFFNRNRGIS